MYLKHDQSPFTTPGHPYDFFYENMTRLSVQGNSRALVAFYLFLEFIHPKFQFIFLSHV